MNALVTAVPGLVPIFVSAGGVKSVNALAGVLFFLFLQGKFLSNHFPAPDEVCTGIDTVIAKPF